MKSLKEIIKESLVIEAADNKTKQLAKDWVKNYFQKSSGRVKIDQDKKSGDVIITYIQPNAWVKLKDAPSLPENIKLNVECKDFYLYGVTGENFLSNFDTININGALYINYSDISLGSPANKSFIADLSVYNEASIKPSKIDNLSIYAVYVNGNCEDLSQFKKAGVKEMILNASSSKYNLDGLDLNKLNITSAGSKQKKGKVELSGNYKVSNLYVYRTEVEGELPKTVDVLCDNFGTTIQGIDKIGTFRMAILNHSEYIENFNDVFSKASKFEEYQAPNKEIPRHEAIKRFNAMKEGTRYQLGLW